MDIFSELKIRGWMLVEGNQINTNFEGVFINIVFNVFVGFCITVPGYYTDSQFMYGVYTHDGNPYFHG